MGGISSADQKRQFDEALNNVRMTDSQIRALHPEIGNKRISKSMKRYIEKQEAQKLVDLIEEAKAAQSLESFKKTVYKYVPREFKDKDHPSLEMFVNICFFVASFTASWAAYILFFPGGREIVRKALESSDGKKQLMKVLARAYLAGSSAKALVDQMGILGSMLGTDKPIWWEGTAAVAIIDQAIARV